MNQPLSPEEQKRIADTVNMIIAGNPADIPALDPHAYKNRADQNTGAVLPAPIGKYVTYSVQGENGPEDLSRIVMDQGGQVYYKNNHYRGFYPVDITRNQE